MFNKKETADRIHKIMETPPMLHAAAPASNAVEQVVQEDDPAFDE